MFKFKGNNQVSLFHGDCLEVMPLLPALTGGNFDMVLTDPPYQLVNWTNPNKWDKALDLTAVWSSLPIKDKGAVILFGNEPYSTFQRNSDPSMFKYDIIWVKNKVTGVCNAKVKPLKTYEVISVFSTGTTAPGRKNNMPYHPQGLTPINKTVKNNKRSRSVISDRPSIKDTYIQEFTGYPKDVIFFDCESGLHPTQKPVALMEYLIKTYTNEGDTVFDFTMGSGTTGVACQNTGRKFVGIELDPDYFNISCQRMGLIT